MRASPRTVGSPAPASGPSGGAAPTGAGCRASCIARRVQLWESAGETISPVTGYPPSHYLLCYSHDHLKEQQQQQ